MKKLLLFTLWVCMGIQADIEQVFSLFQHGKYTQACTIIRKAKRYDVMNARDSLENTLLLAAVLYADALDETHTREQKMAVMEETMNTILSKVGYNHLYVDFREVNWQTPLMIAAKRDYYEIAEYLYLHGANPSMKDAFGHTARDYAPSDAMRSALLSWEWEFRQMRRDVENVWRLFRYGMYESFLSFPLRKLSELELLSMRDKLGNSLVTAAIVFSFMIQDRSYPAKEELIIFVLDAIYNGISDPIARTMLLNVQNKQGQTALMWAVKYGLEGIVDYLYEFGASVLIADNHGRLASDYTEYKPLKKQLLEWQREEERGTRVCIAA